jgi:hypothetical protein
MCNAVQHISYHYYISIDPTDNGDVLYEGSLTEGDVKSKAPNEGEFYVGVECNVSPASR